MSERVEAFVELRVAAPTPSAELAVYDSNLRLDRSSVGDLVGEFPPGLYEVEARIANRSERKVVALRPNSAGATIAAEDWTLTFRSSAPLVRSSLSRERHRVAAEQHSLRPTWVRPGTVGDSRLFLFGRYAKREHSTQPDRLTPTRWLHSPDRFWEGLRLEDALGEQIADFTEGVVWDSGQGWFAFTADLQAGGYCLVGPGPGDVAHRLPLWLGPAFETHVFVPFLDRAFLTDAAVSMAPMGHGFRAGARGSDDGYVRQAVYTEALLAGLRRGRPDLVNPDAVRDWMLSSHFSFPFAGLVAANALLSQEDAEHRLVGPLVGNLRRLLGPHPDVLALELALGVSPSERLSFPPTLRLSFEVMSERASEVGGPDLAPTKELLEAAANALPGPYMVWWRAEPDLVDRFGAMAVDVFRHVATGRFFSLFPPPVPKRVERLCENFAAFMEWLGRQDTRALARDLRLPASLVDDAKRRLDEVAPAAVRVLSMLAAEADRDSPAFGLLDRDVLPRLVERIVPYLTGLGVSPTVGRLLAQGVHLWRLEEGRDETREVRAARARKGLELWAAKAYRAGVALRRRGDEAGEQSAQLLTAALSGLSDGSLPAMALGVGDQVFAATNEGARWFGDLDVRMIVATVEGFLVESRETGLVGRTSEVRLAGRRAGLLRLHWGGGEAWSLGVVPVSFDVRDDEEDESTADAVIELHDRLEALLANLDVPSSTRLGALTNLDDDDVRRRAKVACDIVLATIAAFGRANGGVLDAPDREG
ncbi:hypothetical protein E4V01_24465 [Methylorubrum sp. Q1]|uniref:hypothetical protein n=1 Tax=Methylorubrum sp. Q1 TaxID=2562453 RepID=UPI00107609C9|nr:hypothetical protein [Methylorubrum sp. Q1]TFZ54823.1 hypothetical protein E4V01_24465 [Methylorubrum sp. Q1]